jgi:hypothetical protein
MIVLDEQLLGYGLKAAIARWYRGRVIDLTNLRPASHLLDDAIPTLLRRVRQATFITINVSDFWRRFAPDNHMAILCFDLRHDRSREISSLLRRLLAIPIFKTRGGRMGKVVCVTPEFVQFYTRKSRAIRTMQWPRRKR